MARPRLSLTGRNSLLPMSNLPLEMERDDSQYNGWLTRRQERRDQGLPEEDLTNVFGYEEEDISLLFYIPNIGKQPRTKVVELVRNLDFERFLTDPDKPIGRDVRGPYLFGNQEGQDLMDELHAAFRQIQSGGTEGMIDRYENIFNRRDLRPPKSPEVYFDMATKMALKYMQVRLRTMEHKIETDIHMGVRKSYWYRHRRRISKLNKRVHSGLLEEDAIWISMCSNLDGENPENDFRDLEGYARNAFACTYRISVDEALVLLKYAKQPNPNNVPRIRISKQYCSYFIRFINLYTQYRMCQMGELYRTRTHDRPSRNREWTNRGGPEQDRMYNEFIKIVLDVLRTIQRSATPSPTERRDLFNIVVRLLPAAQDYQYLDNAGNFARSGRAVRLQERLSYNNPENGPPWVEPYVIVNLNEFPEITIQNRTVPLRVDTEFTARDQTGARNTDTGNWFAGDEGIPNPAISDDDESTPGYWLGGQFRVAQAGGDWGNDYPSSEDEAFDGLDDDMNLTPEDWDELLGLQTPDPAGSNQISKPSRRGGRTAGSSLRSTSAPKYRGRPSSSRSASTVAQPQTKKRKVTWEVPGEPEAKRPRSWTTRGGRIGARV